MSKPIVRQNPGEKPQNAEKTKKSLCFSQKNSQKIQNLEAERKKDAVRDRANKICSFLGMKKYEKRVNFVLKETFYNIGERKSRPGDNRIPRPAG